MRGGFVPRTAREDDAGTAMMLVILCLLVTMTLSTALLGVVLSELTPTAYETKAARTVHAAEAGLQAAVSQVRGASSMITGVGLSGNLAQLPCYSLVAPLVGAVGGQSGATSSVSYSVTVAYYSIDPSNQSTAWRTANALPCTSGLGPTGTPLYALIRSSATGPGSGALPSTLGNRSLELVYGLKSSEAGTLGGLIHTDVAGGMPDLCWTAPSAAPAAGDHLTLQACDPGGLPTQMFAYRTDYSLVLAGTQSTTAPGTGGMCVTADSNGNDLLDDVTARADDLTSHGTATTTVAGAVTGGTAASFDGTTSWLGASKSELTPGPGPFTVALRFKATTSGVMLQYMSTTDQTGGTYDRHVWLDSTGHVVFGLWTGSARIVVSPAAYNDGAWHSAAASAGAAGQKLYVDGALVASNATVTAGQSGTGYWHLGWGKYSGWSTNPPTSAYWHGALAHVAFYSSQLSDAQVATLTAPTTDTALRTAVNALTPRSYWPLGYDQTYGTTLSFRTCDGANHQKWSYNDGGKFEILSADGSALANRCITGTSPSSAGTTLILDPDCTDQVWVPEKTVGAGAAGAATQQLINYDQYGRCLDVTGRKTTATWLIAYPCKQDPSGTVSWNQRFVWDGGGTNQLQTQPSAGTYCLTAPTPTSGFVIILPCAAGRTDQQWTMNTDTGNRTTSYTIVSAASGLCLDLGPGQGSGSVSAWSSIVLGACSGSYTQKWNAPPLVGAGGIEGQRETTSG